MAFAPPQFPYQHPQSEAKLVPFYDGAESTVLDSSPLDSEAMQRSDGSHLRRGSQANGPGVLSPPEEQRTWEPHYHGSVSVNQIGPAGSARSFGQERQSFSHHEPGPSHAPQHAFTQGHGSRPWPLEHSSGPVGFGPPSQPFDNQHHLSQPRVDNAHGNINHPMQASHHPSVYAPSVETSFASNNSMHTPMSPHTHQDWMTMAQQEVEGRVGSKRMRQQSPARTTVDMQRRDGIRKKNGRIDIPQERNIQTIDNLIEEATDEDYLKELKQQKRLLRNREAALASRQRKKKHTEDLELREKEFNRMITDLMTRLDMAERQKSNFERNYQLLAQQHQQLEREVQIAREEKMAIFHQHEEETSKLRKQIQILSEPVDAGDAPDMSAAPSSVGLTDFNAEMEALTVGPHDWDNFIYINELQNNDSADIFAVDSRIEVERPTESLREKPSSSLAALGDNSDLSQDQPISSSLIFFLLLCGAFVASKPTNNPSAGLPDVPPDVRAAAPAVLQSLLSDHSLSPHAAGARNSHPSGVDFGPSTPTPGPRMRDRLEHMHDHLTSATKAQEVESAFSLTPAQYAAIAQLDNPSAPEAQQQHWSARQHTLTPSRSRQNLAEALTTMQSEHARRSTAEVYTRSLLWDQIPADVVKQFKEMVRDYDDADDPKQMRTPRQPQHRTPPRTYLHNPPDHDDDVFGIKTEFEVLPDD